MISNIDTLRYLKAKERFRFHAKGTRLVFEKENADRLEQEKIERARIQQLEKERIEREGTLVKRLCRSARLARPARSAR